MKVLVREQHLQTKLQRERLKFSTKPNDYCRLLKFQQTKGLARLEATNDNLADAEKGFTTLNMAVSRFICHLNYKYLNVDPPLLPIYESLSASEPTNKLMV